MGNTLIGKCGTIFDWFIQRKIFSFLHSRILCLRFRIKLQLSHSCTGIGIVVLLRRRQMQPYVLGCNRRLQIPICHICFISRHHIHICPIYAILTYLQREIFRIISILPASHITVPFCIPPGNCNWILEFKRQPKISLCLIVPCRTA